MIQCRGRFLNPAPLDFAFASLLTPVWKLDTIELDIRRVTDRPEAGLKLVGKSLCNCFL